MRPLKIEAPFEEGTLRRLSVGEEVLISGIIYTARDAAHSRLIELIGKGLPLPLPLKNQLFYYTGPTPCPPGKIFGSAGPTSSYRMDSLTVPLLSRGLRGMIGKGQRSEQLGRLLRQYGAVYFLAPAGAGAYLSQRIKRAELVAFPDLGPEAVYRLWVDEFPTLVGIDTKGRDLYRVGANLPFS